MKRILPIGLLLLTATAVWTIPGDLNLDGKVDFDDFFLFADQFGKEGAPDTPDTVITVVQDTLIVVKRDTLERIIEREITVHDTVIQVARDTLVVTQWDTLEQIIEREITVRDTLYQTTYDTIYIQTGGGTAERPPLQSSWSDVVDIVQPSVYWIGYSAKPTADSKYYITFVGTGFAITESQIATNYHVGDYLDQQIKNIRSDLEPVVVAVRAGTQAFGSETYYLGTINQNRDLLGIWDLRYDGTVSSPDLALFLANRIDDGQPAGNLPFLRLTPDEEAMSLRVASEIATLGFPGVLEGTYDPADLTPTPTFKTGTISAVRAYDSSTPLTNAQRIALMGKIIQHDFDASPGNSGSPIFNKRGEVIAVLNAGISGLALDFGIRADELRVLLRSLYLLNGSSHINAKRVVGGAFPQGYPLGE